MNLASFDLNLLVALEALLEERSVTRAAARIGLSQPAASHALARLRDLVADPLLVRTPKGMAPTARAEALLAELRPALDRVRAALDPPGAFDPRGARDAFTLASADYVELVVAGPLVRALRERAPRASLAIRRLSQRHPAPDLESGRVELALGALDDEGPGLYRTLLFRDRMVCLLRAGHPAVEGSALTLDAFVALGHVLVAPRGGSRGSVDAALAARGLARDVALAVPHFSTAPAVVARTDFVATLPERLARAFAPHLGLTVVEPPLPLPEIAIWQLWHERTHASAAHRWLRGLVAEVSAEVARS